MTTNFSPMTRTCLSQVQGAGAADETPTSPPAQVKYGANKNGAGNLNGGAGKDHSNGHGSQN
jgi:hypothetical protein